MKRRQVMRNSIVATALAAVLVWAGVGTAEANTISGKLWHVPEATSQNAIPANVPVTTPDVTFDVISPIILGRADMATGQTPAFQYRENTLALASRTTETLVLNPAFRHGRASSYRHS
jgi:hypothetical protein